MGSTRTQRKRHRLRRLLALLVLAWAGYELCRRREATVSAPAPPLPPVPQRVPEPVETVADAAPETVAEADEPSPPPAKKAPPKKAAEKAPAKKVAAVKPPAGDVPAKKAPAKKVAAKKAPAKKAPPKKAAPTREPPPDA